MAARRGPTMAPVLSNRPTSKTRRKITIPQKFSWIYTPSRTSNRLKHNKRSHVMPTKMLRREEKQAICMARLGVLLVKLDVASP
mmetsp:Transcript_22579/g.52104  ORF Transcript_22579/g.52104 Transcript_22579/m.52104 type:complete len:84 (+) Transcript_22579:495-746(+)